VASRLTMTTWYFPTQIGTADRPAERATGNRRHRRTGRARRRHHSHSEAQHRLCALQPASTSRLCRRCSGTRPMPSLRTSTATSTCRSSERPPSDSERRSRGDGARGYIPPIRPNRPGAKRSLIRPNPVGLARLNSRPLDPQIGPLRLSSMFHCSLVTMVDRRGALNSAVVVRSWSVVSPRLPWRTCVCQPRRGCRFCLASRIWLITPSVEM
jgi:hypothetical protein